MYEQVRQALYLIEEAKTRIHDGTGEITGEIKLLVCANRRVVTHAIEQFKERYPYTSFLLDHHPERSIDQYDIIISDDRTLSPKREGRLLITEDILLAVERRNPLANATTITAADLARENFISMNESSSLYASMETICHQKGFTPKITIRCDDPYYVRQYVSLNLGVALIPSVSWAGLFGENVVLKSIGDYRRQTYAFLHRDRYLPRRVTLFAELLESCCKPK